MSVKVGKGGVRPKYSPPMFTRLYILACVALLAAIGLFVAQAMAASAFNIGMRTLLTLASDSAE